MSSSKDDANYKDCVWVDFDLMEKFMVDVFKGMGVPEEDAKVSANVLITADKRGIDTHGIQRLKPIYYDRIKSGMQKPVTEFEIIRESPTTAVVDCHVGMGHVVSKKSMELAIEKAKKFGMGMVVVRNSTHYGIAGYYPMMAAEAGLIGISGTNTRPGVAPTFGVENILGTNPLTFAVPTDEEFPFVLDCATPIIQRGTVEVAARTGKKMHEGLVVGEDGKSMTDPDEILEKMLEGKASLLPLGGIGEDLGGHKGYGYCTVVEILSTALSGAAFLKHTTGVNQGHFFIAIDVSTFTEVDEFKKRTGDILRDLRASKKAPGQERIYTAGEKEYLVWLERKDKGVPVNKSIQKEILQMAKELDLKGYDFGF
jgi:LDH2 family malate/lactate/ureidoglycolate dehydrogenase